MAARSRRARGTTGDKAPRVRRLGTNPARRAGRETRSARTEASAVTARRDGHEWRARLTVDCRDYRPATHHKVNHQHRDKDNRVTDQNVNVNAGQDDDDDGLFDGATDTFPRRNDLRDRLVVVYPTGKRGTRQGDAADSKPYPWFETITVVVDDGPDGWQEMVPDDDGDMTPNLVPSVADNGPQVINLQWSATGLVSRIQQKLPGADGKPGSIMGRINVKKNKVKGRSAPWSIAPPTEEDYATCRRFRAELQAARKAVTDANVKAADDDAF